MERVVFGGTPNAEQIEFWLTTKIAAELKVPLANVDPVGALGDIGLSSLGAVHLSLSLEKWLDMALPATLFWEFESLRDLSAHLAAECRDKRARARD
jgi:acyl carrier protein